MRNRPYETNRDRVSYRRIPKSIEPILKNPEAWKYYGHYNDMTWEELQDEIQFRKDGMKYQDEFEFMCELYSRKKNNLSIIVPTI